MWFDHSGGLAGIREFLTNYAKSGQFVSRLPLHPKGDDLTFIYDVDGEKQTYLNLEENIRATRVFNQTGESNSMGELIQHIYLNMKQVTDYKLLYYKTLSIKNLENIHTNVNSVILNDIEGMVPHPSQYFYCDSPQASIANLSRFLECSRKFSFIPYYLIKVESLTLELREHLIEWLTIISDVGELVNLTLVFYDISRAERYSFIDHVAVQNQTLENSKKLLSTKMNSNNPNGVSIVCYCSPSETGKSYEIKKRLDKFDKNYFIKYL